MRGVGIGGHEKNILSGVRKEELEISANHKKIYKKKSEAGD